MYQNRANKTIKSCTYADFSHTMRFIYTHTYMYTYCWIFMLDYGNVRAWVCLCFETLALFRSDTDAHTHSTLCICVYVYMCIWYSYMLGYAVLCSFVFSSLLLLLFLHFIGTLSVLAHTTPFARIHLVKHAYILHACEQCNFEFIRLPIRSWTRKNVVHRQWHSRFVCSILNGHVSDKCLRLVWRWIVRTFVDISFSMFVV